MEWFLITSSEHLGPFNDDVMHQLFNNGDVTVESLVWREGWSDARTFQDVFLDSNLNLKPNTIEINDQEDDQFPDLPPEFNPPTEVVSEVNIDTDFKSKVTAEDEIQFENTESLEQESSTEDSSEEEFDFDFEKTEVNILARIKVVAIIFLIIAVISPVVLYFKNATNVFDRPQSMSLGDYNRLRETAVETSKKLKFSFSLALDKRTLWISTNLPLEGEVFLKFKSKPGRTLGGEIELKAKGELKRRLIVLSEFQFIKGTRFTDGIYDIEIFTVEKLDVPPYQRFFEPWDKEFRYLDKVTITSLHAKEFQRQMKLISDKKLENKNAFWSELQEKYRTVKNMTTQIRDAVGHIFTGPREEWAKLVSEFENDYKAQYGVFFTSFVTTNEYSYEKLINKDFEDKFEIISNYTRLSKLAKLIGSESMTILQNLESFDPLLKSEEEIKHFELDSLTKLDRIIEECERKLSLIKN
jgi:hypothetical protein